MHLHNKRIEVCIEARSPSASLQFKGQVSQHAIFRLLESGQEKFILMKLGNILGHETFSRQIVYDLFLVGNNVTPGWIVESICFIFSPGLPEFQQYLLCSFWKSLNPTSKKNGPSLILLTSKCSYFHRCLFQAVNAIFPVNPRNTYVWTRYIVTI